MIKLLLILVSFSSLSCLAQSLSGSETDKLSQEEFDVIKSRDCKKDFLACANRKYFKKSVIDEVGGVSSFVELYGLQALSFQAATCKEGVCSITKYDIDSEISEENRGKVKYNVKQARYSNGRGLLSRAASLYRPVKQWKEDDPIRVWEIEELFFTPEEYDFLLWQKIRRIPLF